MYAKKGVSAKAVALLLAVVLIIGCVVGGTIAFLKDESETVTNTFVVGNIGNLGLTETTGANYMVIPGVDIVKDPVVTFSGNNVDAYVFLEVTAAKWTVTENEGVYTYSLGNGKMSWVLADGWTQVEGKAGVYYREVAANAAAASFPVIKDNAITVSPEITQAEIADYANTLTFNAYAIQKAKDGNTAGGIINFTPAEAWAEFKS